MATKATTKTNPKKSLDKLPLSATLKTISATEGVAKLRTLHGAHEIIPTAALPAIEPKLNRLEAVLQEQNITAYELAAQPSVVLSILTGVPSSAITEDQPTEVANELHAYRNLALAVAALAASTIAVDSAATSPAAVYSHAVTLRARSTETRRPFAHDEIVLCRVAAHLAATADPRDHTATIYTMLDAGQVVAETTQVRINDFDDPEKPQTLLSAGNAHLAARFISLDGFASHTLGSHLEKALRAGRSPQASLTYTPRDRKNGPKHQPGSRAGSSSAQRIIDRFIGQLGLPTRDVTATSITQWRIATTLVTHGVEAAFALSGRKDVEKMLHALGTSGAKPVNRPADHNVSFAAAA